MSIGIVGLGYVGSAIKGFFRGIEPLKIYDIKRPDLDTLDDVVMCDLVFVAVPTPITTAHQSSLDGSCDTSIVKSVLENLVEAGRRMSRILPSAEKQERCEFVTVIKSTIPPGFTTAMAQALPLRLVFSPEFLTEKNAVADYANARHVIAGGSVCDTQIYFDFMKKGFGEKACRVKLAQTDRYENAEMAKLFVNVMLAAKVAVANEIHQICLKLSIDYSIVSFLGTMDWRIGNTHVDVPGPDGKLGFGGSCFPKDIANLRHVAKIVGSGEKVLSAIIERNNEIRGSK